MSPKLLLRIAAIAMFLHTIGHTLAAITWDQPPTPQVGTVLTAMKDNHFEFFATDVSLAKFYQGFGYSMVFVLVFITILLWLSAGYTDNIFVRRLLPVVTTLLVALAIIEWLYFFAIPAGTTSLAAILCLVAYLKSKLGNSQ